MPPSIYIFWPNMQYNHYVDVCCHDAGAESPLSADVASSFSQGFFRFSFVDSVPCPVRTVSGICLMPGIGWPVVTSSTMCAKEVGYGAGGSFGLVVVGKIPPAASVLAAGGGGCTPFGAWVWGRELRYAL